MFKTSEQKKADQERIAYLRKLRKDLKENHTLEELVALFKDVHQTMELVEHYTRLPVGKPVRDYSIALRFVVLQLDRDESDKLDQWVRENTFDPVDSEQWDAETVAPSLH